MNKLPPSSLTTSDRIRLHFIEGDDLSEEDQAILTRLKTAHALVLDEGENDRKIVSILMQQFGISERTAWRDLRMSKNVLGDAKASSREAWRYIVSQWATDMYRMAKQTKNFKAMEKAFLCVIKANNLDKDNLDIPDPSKIHPPVQLLTINFNLINSPRFKLIDPAAQKALLQLYDEVMSQIVITPLGEYADLFSIDDQARLK